MKRIHRIQLKVLLKEYKMMCVKAIADGDFEKAKEYKQRIKDMKNWLKPKKE